MVKLFTNYNLKVRPALSPEDRVVVRVGMVLSSLVGLVRPKTLTLSCLHTHTHNQNTTQQWQVYRQTVNIWPPMSSIN